jgi:hypothetical protein
MGDLLKIDLKTLIAIAGSIAVLGGFYFTTQLRLDTLEDEIQALTTELHEVKLSNTKRIKQLGKKINKLNNIVK